MTFKHICNHCKLILDYENRQRKPKCPLCGCDLASNELDWCDGCNDPQGDPKT